jgi:hypothetical protein
MLVMDAMARILKQEGMDTLFCFPTTPIIEAAVAAGLRPVICRQERVGVDMASGFARVANGRPPTVFAMQYADSQNKRPLRQVRPLSGGGEFFARSAGRRARWRASTQANATQGRSLTPSRSPS